MQELLTGVGIWASRHISLKETSPLTQVMKATGTIDQMVIWDQLMNWFPQALWSTQNTPIAAQLPDVDSNPDPMIAMAFALAAVDDMGFAVTTDALRHEPPELAQALLTLATTTEKQGTLYLGAGEVRNHRPFGRDRTLGLRRLEDSLQVLQKLLKEYEPVSMTGRTWSLEDAFLGNGGKTRRPEVITMGGGPRLIEASLQHADGWSTGAPFVFADADQYAKEVVRCKRRLDELGRDPEEFVFGLHHILFICEDKEAFEQHLDNPLVKWYAATGGRINQRDWGPEGIDPVFPEDWHYAFDMCPGSWTEEQILAVTDRVSPDMVRKTYFYGTPEDIAAEIAPFVEAGASRHMIADVSGLCVETDPVGAIQTMGEVCGLIKKNAASPF